MYLWMLCGICLLAACKKEKTPPQKNTAVKIAIAKIEGKSGSELTGEAVFTQQNTKVSLTLAVDNATPGTHAVHLHEWGDCSADDAASAGAHWNPTHEKHGKWGEKSFHLGDVGNIEVGENGRGILTFSTDKWQITGNDADKNIVGKSIVLHAEADNFTTQPTGAAGIRQGCGVINIKK